MEKLLETIMIYDKKIAKRYAKAFLHDSMDKKEVDNLSSELESFIQAIDSDEKTKQFFISPVYSRDTKLNIIKVLGKNLEFSAYTLSLLEILIKNDRMGIISEVLDQIHAVMDRIHSRVRINVTTAHEPSVKEIEELTRKISDFFGRKAIVKRYLDKSIIGGFMIEGDGKLIDMSVKGQIERALSEI